MPALSEDAHPGGGHTHLTSSDPRVYLLHIRDCCTRILECGDLKDRTFVPNYIFLDNALSTALAPAVCRNLEILGEASRKIGEDFRGRHPDVPWRKMNDLRNVLIHNYEDTDSEIVWGVVERDIPQLLASIVGLLE